MNKHANNRFLLLPPQESKLFSLVEAGQIETLQQQWKEKSFSVYQLSVRDIYGMTIFDAICHQSQKSQDPRFQVFLTNISETLRSSWSEEQYFYSLIASNQVDFLQDLLNENNIDLDLPLIIIEGEEAKKTPLQIAARFGCLEMATFLIGWGGVNINGKDKLFQTPLHEAAWNGQQEMVDFLLSQGAVITDNNDRSTPLHNAAWKGYLSVMQSLLKKDKTAINAQGYLQRTPLHQAAWQNHLEIVRLLLAEGADINIPDQSGYTPFHVAAKNENLAMLRLLLSKGANVNWEDTVNHHTVLHLAVQNNDLSMVTFLVDHGANVNSRDGLDNTPLHIAAEQGRLEMVTFLLQNGADLNASNFLGIVPLHSAIANGYLAVAAYLQTPIPGAFMQGLYIPMNAIGMQNEAEGEEEIAAEDGEEIVAEGEEEIAAEGEEEEDAEEDEADFEKGSNLRL